MLQMVSIIVPTYNRPDLLPETIKSVLNQTYENWECIIVDDRSAVDMQKTVAPFLSDSRIKFYKRPANRIKGASSCRNYGLEVAKGDLIQFLDDDDLLGAKKLEEQVRKYSGGFELLTCKWGGFDTPSDLKSRFKYRYNSYRNFNKPIKLLRTFGEKNEFFPLHVYLTPKLLIEKSGWWNESISNNDDAEFFTRIILNASKIKFSSNSSVYYRYYGSNKLSDFTDKKKVLSAIKSWELISYYIKEKYPGSAPIYVENAKSYLKNTLETTFPEIIKEEEQFFRSNKVTFLHQIRRKLSAFLQVKSKRCW